MKAFTLICFMSYILFTALQTVLTIRDIEMTAQAKQRLINQQLGRSPAIALNGNKE